MKDDRDERFSTWLTHKMHPKSSIFNQILIISIMSAVLIMILYTLSAILNLSLPSPFLMIIIVIIILFFVIYIYLYLQWKTNRIIQIKLEKDVVKPGETVSGYIELRVDKPLRINGLTAVFWGGERTVVVVSRGKHSTTYVEERAMVEDAPELEPQGLAAAMPKTFAEAKTLSPGNYIYGFSVVIPQGGLPSWSGWRGFSGTSGKGISTASSHPVGSRTVGVSYYIRIHLDVKERIDARKVHEIIVRPEPVKPVRKPTSFSTRHAKPGSARPGLHVNLESAETEPDGEFSGRVTLHNPTGKRIRSFKVSLMEKVWGIAQRHAQTITSILTETEIKPMDEKGGGYMPFTLKVPVTARPSVHGKISAIYHTIVVEADIAFARDIKAEGRVVIVPR
jgi:hypothetical protein